MASPNSEKVDNMINRAFGSCTIQEKIAVGGFGTVYKARDVKLEVTRAIKIFHPHLSEEKGFKKRFEIEMRLLAQLDHVNIVRIINAIDEPDATGFVMEFIEGRTLADILEQDGSLPIAKALDIFIQVGKAIAYAHNLKHQIIHRDLSPDNIMLRPDQIVKIMDFGIAKTIGSEKVTQTGIVLGKPTYMAPEQFEGTVSIYTDQYALGVILYEMLTGRVPFDAESPIALYKLHLNEAPVPPKEINDQIPTYVNNIILKSLAKDEKDRFKTVDQMLESLINQGSPTSFMENKVAPLILKANEALKDEKFDEALHLYNEALMLEPTNKEVQLKIEETIKLKESHRDQDLIEEWFHQAQAFYDSGMQDEAGTYVQDFLKISRQYSNSRTVQKYKATLQKKMPKIFASAEEFLNKELEEVDKITKVGKKLFQHDKFDEALEKFNEALSRDPYSEILRKLKALCEKKIKMAQVAASYRDGIMALKNEKYDEALQAFTRVLELNPDHKEAKKYKEMAEGELEKMAKNRTELESTYREALDLYEKWEFTQAIEKFKRVLEIDNSHMSAKAMLSDSIAKVDEENKMEEIGFFYNQGMTFYKSQQWDKAIKCFERVLKYLDNHKGALEYKHLAELKLTQQAQIEESYQDALENFRNSQYTQALRTLDYILTLDKNHKGARQYRNLCCELQGLSTEGEESSVNVGYAESAPTDQEGQNPV